MPKPKLTPAQEFEVVALYARLKITELAAKFNCSGGTIRRILHRHEALAPRFATKHERAVIRRLSGRRTRKEIAAFLGKSLSCIKFWQRRQGFRAHPKMNPELENQIIALYENHSQIWVARETNVSEKQVHAVLLRRGIPLRKGGNQPMLTPQKRQQAVAMIRGRNMYCRGIAAKLGVSRDSVEKLAHAVTGCERFFGGALWPPLQSVFPQRHQEWTANDLVRFLSTIFPDGVPVVEDYVIVPRIVSVLLETFPFWREATTPDLLGLENHLVTALSTLRAESESALVQ